MVYPVVSSIESRCATELIAEPLVRTSFTQGNETTEASLIPSVTQVFVASTSIVCSSTEDNHLLHVVRMYSISKLTHPATAVEHALSCNFFHRAEKSLIVAGANVIRVFRLIPDVDPNKKERFADNRPPKMKLECLATYTLFGNVMSMQAVSLAGSQRDSLLISFRDAKLSVVEYDPEAHDLRTLSLHYFEEEDMRMRISNIDMEGGWTHHYHIPMVRVDPEGRCAVMLVYGRKLVVLPFRRETALDDPDLSMADVKTGPGSSKVPVLASYMIVLKELDEKMDNVIDVQFLHGYYEPTLLILYEPVKTFPGRIAVRKDTCAMVAISLNIQQKVHPIIWSVSNLPFDCTQAIPVKWDAGRGHQLSDLPQPECASIRRVCQQHRRDQHQLPP
uniref:RSE1/DDB1/CPSF1 first beta-propeller domain-containing protein n=1 Tax=Timema douglasi TaxID=61478 RepID=A0A7R8VQ36_TIMDO|nr:unnamed protein product [Timema douglasi]